MVHTLLKPLLKRGALVAAANWQVTVAQASADAVFKLLVATPVVGGVFLVALIIGAEPGQVLSLEWRDLITTVASSLLAHPFALLSLVLALALVLVAGSVVVFVVKAGTIATLVRGEQRAPELGATPIHLEDITAAAAFTPESYVASARALFGRYALLGVCLMAVYAVSGVLYLFVVLAAGVFVDAWGLVVGTTLAFVVWVTLVNFFYLLAQIVIAVEDCSLLSASRRIIAFLARDGRQVTALFAVVLLLVVMATGAAFVATIVLGLIGFVPFLGLAVLPIQLLAWLFRGVVFQFLGLSSVGAYLRLYRASIEAASREAALVSPALGGAPSTPNGPVL